MESHTSTTVEAPVAEESNVESLPQESTQDSFLDALDAALDNINNPEVIESIEQKEQEAIEQVEETSDAGDTLEESSSEESSSEDNTEVAAEEKQKLNSEDPIEELNEDIGDDWTPKAANRFKKLKEELRSNKSELDILRQTVKEQESRMSELSAIAESKDVEYLQEQLKQYEIEKSFNDLENTPQYKEAVSDPLNKLMDKAEVIAEKYEADYDTLVDILAMEDSDKQDQALSELLPEATSRDKASLYRIIEDIDPIIERRNSLYENADEALKEAQYIQEQQKQADLAEKAQVRSVITRNVVQRVNEKLPFLAGVEGLDMSLIEEKASSLDPSVVHPVDFAYNSVASQLLPTIVREYLSSRAEAEVLMNKLSEYEDAEPTVSGAPKTDSSSRTSNPDISFQEAINAALSGV